MGALQRRGAIVGSKHRVADDPAPRDASPIMNLHGECAMSFRIRGIDPAPIQPLFALSDDELQASGMKRVVADAAHGYPCRVSLVDAAIGEELMLLPYYHQPARSPYQSRGPIFVRRDASAPWVLRLPYRPRLRPTAG